MLKDCERTGQEDSGQIVEALIPLTKGHTFFFNLQTGNGKPLRVTELERGRAKGGIERFVPESSYRAFPLVRLSYEKWFVSEWLEKSWLTKRDNWWGLVSSYTPTLDIWGGLRWTWRTGMSRIVKLCLGSAGGILWSLSDVSHT